MIIAIDTSTDQAGIAFCADSGPLGELLWIAGRDHSTQLFRALDSLSDLTGKTIDQATHVAIAAGPGSFSGLRVGLSAGKALALGLGVPLVAVGTLDIVAAGACASTRVWAVLRAGRGQLYLASYESGGLPTSRISEYIIASPMEAQVFVSEGDHVAGEGVELLVAALNEAGKSVTVDPPIGTMRRAVYLAELGRMYFARGGPDQLNEAEPLYLRRSSAEEKRDAAQR